MSTTHVLADRPARELAIVRGIVRLHAGSQHARTFLFGSHATGRAVRSSDIDVALLGTARIPSAIILDLRDALDDANILARVHVVDLHTVEPSFRERVIREGIEWTD